MRPGRHDPQTPPPESGGGALRGRLLLLLAGVIVLLAGCYGWMQSRARTAEGGSGASAPVGAASGSDAAAIHSVPSPVQRDAPNAIKPHDDMSADISDYIPPGAVPSTGEVIARLRAAGVHSGIAAFNPPGTSPPLVGIAVPEDFELPEGYVSHGQATDDGQTIEPILMFSPDYEFFDAQGNRIVVPENRVVPPQYAPPGLEIRMIRIPRPV